MNYRFRSNTFSKIDMESLGTLNSSSSQNHFKQPTEQNLTDPSTGGFPSLASTFANTQFNTKHQHGLESQFVLLACELERVSKAYEECIQELEFTKSHLYSSKNSQTKNSNESEKDSLMQQISFLKKKNKVLEQVAKENYDPMNTYDNSILETQSTLELKNRQQEELISHLEIKLKNVIAERDSNISSVKSLTTELRNLSEEMESLKRLYKDQSSKIQNFKARIQEHERKSILGGQEKFESEKVLLQAKIEEYKSIAEELEAERNFLYEEKSKWKSEQSLRPKLMKLESERTQILLQMKEKISQLEILESKCIKLELENKRLRESSSIKDSEVKMLEEKLTEARKQKEIEIGLKLELQSELEEMKGEKELLEEEMIEAGSLWNVLREQNENSQYNLNAKCQELEIRLRKIDTLEKDLIERVSLSTN